MKIGLDIMGGDFAPKAAVLGAMGAQKMLSPDEKIVLIGDKKTAQQILVEQGADPDLFEFIHTESVIGMAEHPTKAIAQKPESSISIGSMLLQEGKIDAFSSAGNSGAVLVAAVFNVKPIPGVSRPCISSVLPKFTGGTGLLLDVGANADCKPETLLQFAILGSVYAESVLQIETPNVALMNIGEEEEKGNQLSVAAHTLFRNSKSFNFVGNIEGRNLFDNMSDVVVCDGFTGNILLKMAESFYMMTVKKGFKDDFFDRFNYEQYGGSPILGINAPVLIGHGISSPEAFKNMLIQSKHMVKNQLINKIKLAFK